MARHVFRVKPGGRFGVIYHDEIRGLIRKLDPKPEFRRAADVEPYKQGWGVFVREWVRPGGSLLLDNPGVPFESREAALAAEVAYLRHLGL